MTSILSKFSLGRVCCAVSYSTSWSWNLLCSTRLISTWWNCFWFRNIIFLTIQSDLVRPVLSHAWLADNDTATHLFSYINMEGTDGRNSGFLRKTHTFFFMSLVFNLTPNLMEEHWLDRGHGWFFWTTPVDLHIRWEVWAENSRPYPVCYHQGEGTVLRRGALASLQEHRNGVQKKIRADTSCQLLAIISRKKSWWVCELLLSDNCWLRVVRIQKNNSTFHRWLCLHYF